MDSEKSIPQEIEDRYIFYLENGFKLNRLAFKFVMDRIPNLPMIQMHEQSQQRQRLVQEMKEEFTSSTDYLELKQKLQGTYQVAEMSCKQWIKLQRNFENKDVEAIKTLTVTYMLRIARNLACLFFMLMGEYENHLNKRFQLLRLACSFMASMSNGADLHKDSNTGIGTAYWMILPFFDKFEEEVSKLSFEDEVKLEAKKWWYKSVKEIDLVIELFITAMSKIDTYLSLPSLDERMLFSVGPEFEELKTEVESVVEAVSNLENKFVYGDSSSLAAVEKFVIEFNTEVIVQRCEDFLRSDGLLENEWLKELSKAKSNLEEFLDQRAITEQQCEIEEAAFMDAERSLEKYRADFVVLVKGVLNTSKFEESTNLALDFGKFYVGEKASIITHKSMDRASPARKKFIAEISDYPKNAADKDYIILAEDMRGNNATYGKKNVIQLLKTQKEPKPDSELGSLLGYAIELGTRLSESLAKFMVMMMSGREAQLVLKVKKLKDTFRFLRELYIDWGPAAFADNNFVYQTMIGVMTNTEIELKRAQGANQDANSGHFNTNWAPLTEGKIDNVLHKFVKAVGKMETLLSFPMALPTANKTVLQMIDRTHLKEVEEILNDDVNQEAGEGKEMVKPGLEGCVLKMESIFTSQHKNDVVGQVMERMKEYIDAEWENLRGLE